MPALVSSDFSDLDPHWDAAHFRPVENEARREIVGLLGDEKKWFHGFNDGVTTEPGPSNIGLMFRNGKKELILFFTSIAVGGTLNGQRFDGTLEREDTIEDWKKRYAQPELHGK